MHLQFDAFASESQVFAIACLYLAGKVEDSPKSVREVLQWCLKKRYRFHPEIANQFSSQRDWYDKARERVFMAERALLYEMGFSFGVEHMYPVILGVLSEPRTPQDALDQPAGMAEARADLQARGGCRPGCRPGCRRRRGRGAPYTQAPALQSAIANLGFQMANESLKTTLCLQYTGVKIGAACTWLAIKMLQLDPLPEARAGWWARMGLSPEELDDIVSQLLEIYTPAAAEVVAGQADLMLTGIEVVGADAAAAAAAAQQQQAAAAAAAKQQQQQQQRQPPANGALAGGAAGGAGAGAAGEVAAGIEELDELEHFLSG
eukprot:scaffold23.g4085.t1